MVRPKTIDDETILKIAKDVILEEGTSVSVQKIADRVGISQPALFKRFGTKENLIKAIFSTVPKPQWVELAKKGVNDQPIEEQLLELSKKILNFYKDLHPIMRVMKSSGISHFDMFRKEKKPLPVEGSEVLTNWFEEAYQKRMISKTDFRIAAHSLLGTLQVEVFIALLSKDDNLDIITEDYLKKTIETLLYGIKRG